MRAENISVAGLICFSLLAGSLPTHGETAEDLTDLFDLERETKDSGYYVFESVATESYYLQLELNFFRKKLDCTVSFNPDKKARPSEDKVPVRECSYNKKDHKIFVAAARNAFGLSRIEALLRAGKHKVLWQRLLEADATFSGAGKKRYDLVEKEHYRLQNKPNCFVALYGFEEGSKEFEITLKYDRDNEKLVFDMSSARAWKLLSREVRYEDNIDVFKVHVAKSDGMDVLGYLSSQPKVTCASFLSLKE